MTGGASRERALVLGAGVQLGTELRRTAPASWDVVYCTRAEADLAVPDSVARAIGAARPSVVINAAAYTAVDRAEREPEVARAVNATGVAALATHVRDAGARLVHVSTDFVFDGAGSRPYTPHDPAEPVGVYGATKREGEEAVLATLEESATVLRTAWLYASHGRNFALTMLRLMRERDEVRVVADQVGTPTWARPLADACWRAAGSHVVHGVHHWTDAGVASWYDFAVAIQEEALALGLLDRVAAVRPIRTIDFPTPARRPSYSVLDKTATWAVLGPAAHWRVALRSMLGEMVHA